MKLDQAAVHDLNGSLKAVGRVKCKCGQPLSRKGRCVPCHNRLPKNCICAEMGWN